MATKSKDIIKLAPWIRSGVMGGVAKFLRGLGIEPLDVIGPEGVRIAEASDQYRKVDFASALKIFSALVDVTGRNDICLELGLEQKMNEWGPFGFLFLNAPTAYIALKDLCKFGSALQSHSTYRLIEKNNAFGVSYTSNHPELEGWEMDDEVTIAFIMSIINDITKDSIIPKQIHLQHQPICELSQYKKWLGVIPKFGANINAITYSNTVANRVIPNNDPRLYDILSRHVRDLAVAANDEDQLINFIRNNIGRGLTNGTATLEHIAAETGLEVRTLQRRLHDEGTSFQVLADEVRYNRSKYYLQKTQLSITDIALELGYAEASVFTRAFKRIAGVNPKQYRHQYKS